MTIYNAADLLTKPVPGIDQGIVLSGTINNSGVTASGDLMRPLKIPAGVRVTAILINVRSAFGATAPASIGLSHIDNSAVPASVAAVASQAMAAATDTTHASTGSKLVMLQAGAFVTTKDSYFEVLFGAVVTGAAGIADYVVIGEFVGSK